MASSENITKAIQSVFLGAPKLEAEIVLKLVSIFTYDGESATLKATIRDIPDEMVYFLDSKFNDFAQVEDLVTVGKLFRLESNYRSGNLIQDYTLTNGSGGIRVKYKAKTPIIGFVED